MTLAVKLSQLGQVVWVSAVAGLAITTTYSVAIYAAGHYLQAQRTGLRGRAFGFAALVVACLLVFFGGVIYGVDVMLSK